MTSIYLVGPMGSGKSTVMEEILDQLGLVTGTCFQVWPSAGNNFRGEPLEDIVTGELRGLYLGRHREDFAGTDAIGYTSHPEALAWLAESSGLFDLILGEGQRLGTAGFLTALAARTDLTVGYLTAPQDVLDERLEARWSGQTATYKSGRVIPKASFRKGVATWARNAVAGARAAGVQVVDIDTSVLSPQECARILLKNSSVKV